MHLRSWEYKARICLLPLYLQKGECVFYRTHGAYLDLFHPKEVQFVHSNRYGQRSTQERLTSKKDRLQKLPPSPKQNANFHTIHIPALSAWVGSRRAAGAQLSKYCSIRTKAKPCMHWACPELHTVLLSFWWCLHCSIVSFTCQVCHSEVLWNWLSPFSWST